jgi:hypothetical protein
VSYNYSGTGSTTYSASTTAPTTVGTYQVIATVVSDENYKGASSLPYNFTIIKANSTIAVTGLSSYVYSGQQQGPSANIKTGSTGAVTYSYSGNGTTVLNASSTAPTNVGTYIVTVSLAADDNNNAAIDYNMKQNNESITTCSIPINYSTTIYNNPCFCPPSKKHFKAVTKRR